ncbi:MAG: DUF4954 family protein [Bacteroidaceae bacterium]|nr:DUF4954 family protein [Bacteroidaceae bacterium]
MQYRNLTQPEIEQLEQQGCTAEDWAAVTIHPELNPKYVRQVRFSGTCRIGQFQKAFTMPGGIHKHSGLFHVTLHNVSVGDDCCIENIKNYIANYDIEPDCFIENVDIILVDGETRFGNGVEVSVLNETGGREVTIHERLTAQEAYMQAMYRHRPTLTGRLKVFADEIAENRRSDRGRIGRHSTIVDTGYIKNLYVGPYSKIEGAGKLKNGSLMSHEDSPVHIGYGVIAEDFIVQDGSQIEDCTTLSRVYVGQSCTLGHGYSASDSLFFCNCQEENGEACAIFAGPFTVTHHKSTLLIAGMFSFMNAGSGSNQSNHMYKLGPIHQGALERGAKTASDSYLLWPARIGAFSLVMGRHSTNPDTSALPFSYLIEKQGETWLAPAVNLRSVGTIRDAQKWPKRDRRPQEGRLDLVNFNLLSPYTIDKMVQGLDVLQRLKALSGATSDTYTYQSAKITHSSLERGISLYRIAIHKFLGNSLISRLEKVTREGLAVSAATLKPESPIGEGDWLDLSGLIAPHSTITQLMNEIEEGRVAGHQTMTQRLSDIHRRYYDLEWAWAYQLLLRFYDLRPEDLDRNETLVAIVRDWKQAVVELDQMLYQDARKEFSLSTKTGFGFDGNRSTAEADFQEVRGEFQSNPFVTAVEEHIRVKSALGDKWIALLS